MLVVYCIMKHSDSQSKGSRGQNNTTHRAAGGNGMGNSEFSVGLCLLKQVVYSF